MGSTTDKIKGTFNEAAGSAKEATGKVIDSPELEGEGVLQKMKGKGQTALGEAKDAIADGLDAAAAKAKELAKDAKDAVHKATE